MSKIIGLLAALMLMNALSLRAQEAEIDQFI